MTDNRSVADLRPDGMPDYMVGAWLSALRVASSNPNMMDAYRRDTGDKWTPAQDPLGRMIDAHLGRDWDFIRGFVKWFNAAIWGEVNYD